MCCHLMISGSWQLPRDLQRSPNDLVRDLEGDGQQERQGDENRGLTQSLGGVVGHAMRNLMAQDRRKSIFVLASP